MNHGTEQQQERDREQCERERRIKRERRHHHYHADNPPPSPELISSLISSLSSISVPLQNHFDNGPSADQLASSEVPSDHADSLLHPDHATIAPVIRMSRAASSESHKSSPERQAGSNDSIPAVEEDASRSIAGVTSARSNGDQHLRSLRSEADLEEAGRSGSLGVETLSRDRSPCSPHLIGMPSAIPTRQSSLRHSHSPSSARKSRSGRHGRYSSRGSNSETVDRRTIFEDGGAVQTARRIQEVKEQQQRIKSEYQQTQKQTPTPMPTPAPTPEKAAEKHAGTRHSSARSGIIDWEPLLENSEHASDNESAPSPSVMTGKSRTRNGATPERRNSIYALERSLSQSGKRHHRRLPSGSAPSSGASIAEERPSSADSVKAAVSARLSSLKLTQKVVHPATGRIIAFSEVGDPKGHVVLCCLGMGVTRYLMAFYDELARSLHLRLITLDRPGIGESGPFIDEAGTPLTWPGEYFC